MMANQHFFKPLLPGFHNHLTIPIAFFLKCIKGRSEQTIAKLRSDASKKIWEVKVEDGKKLTHGWKEFALAHDLRIGDIVVFRLERDMAFHVTLFGPSCCEIQYGSCLDNEEIQRKKNPRRKAKSSSLDPSCFVANVSHASLRDDILVFPRPFVRANGLETRRGEIVMMNEKGKPWTFVLKQKNLSPVTYIRRGWRSFCRANKLSAGNFSTFKLIQRGKTLVLRFLPTEPEEESSEGDEVESLSTQPESDEERRPQEYSKGKEEKRRSVWKPSSSPSKNRFVTVTLTHANFRTSRLVLPVGFTKVTGIKKAKKVSLVDKHGVKWPTTMLFEETTKRMRLVGSWREFCNANCVEIGESIILELVWETDTSSVLKFSSKTK